MNLSPRIKYFAFLCLTLLSFTMTEICQAAAQPPMPVGRVVWIKGNLKAVMANKEERILKDKSIIYLHDTLVTDANSQAQIGFTDQTMMTFRENTKFNVTRYQYSPGAKKGGEAIMNLIEGGFRTITGAVAKNSPNHYAVNTPVATIGVRGTEYQVYTQGEKTLVGYYNGTPCVRARRKQECERYRRNQLSKFETQKEKLSLDTLVGHHDVVCLSDKVRWVKVEAPCGDPTALSSRPDEFKDDLEITEVEIEPFTPSVQRTNDFCIQ